MNCYEGMYILDATLPDEKLRELVSTITGELAQKGEVFGIEQLGKKPLPHPVRKMTEGFYFVAYFSSDPAEISRLQGRYSLNASIVRVMILKRNEEEVKKIKQRLGAKADAKGEIPTVTVTDQPTWEQTGDRWKDSQDISLLPEDDSEDLNESTEELQ